MLRASSDDLPDDWREQIARRSLVRLRASSNDLVAAAIYPSPGPFPKEGGPEAPGVIG